MHIIELLDDNILNKFTRYFMIFFWMQGLICPCDLIGAHKIDIYIHTLYIYIYIYLFIYVYILLYYMMSQYDFTYLIHFRN